jgi:hypothetical protein
LRWKPEGDVGAAHLIAQGRQPHHAAAARLAFEQPLRLELPDDPPQGVAGDAELMRQIALGRQQTAIGPHAGQDLLPDPVGHRLRAGAGAADG